MILQKTNVTLWKIKLWQKTVKKPQSNHQYIRKEELRCLKSDYIINGQEVEGQKTESIQIEDQGEGNVAFKNSYTPKLYEVSIRKQDILNNEDIEGASLQIQNKDTGEIISIDSSKDGQKVKLGKLIEAVSAGSYYIDNPSYNKFREYLKSGLTCNLDNIMD